MKQEEIIKVNIPKGYEFAGVDDNNQQVVFEKVKSQQYPTTVKECCETLKLLNHARNGIPGYGSAKLWALQKLLICRDAYWKLADDWKPDWESGKMYYIYYNPNVHEIAYGLFSFGSSFQVKLVFPTLEMRDAFYDNFEKEIEECKELL